MVTSMLPSSFFVALCLGIFSLVAGSLVYVPTDGNGVAFHNVVVSEGVHAPDGSKSRMVYLVNGEFASHIVSIDEGSILQLKVKSEISAPFTLHAHGILQSDSPWMDGVPGVTQKPILPGESYTYKFKVEQFGMYHIHAHYKGLQDDGLYMGLLVRPSPNKPNPFAKISADPAEQELIARAELNSHPMMLMDWRHYTSGELYEIWSESNIEPLCVNAILYNGQGSAVCPSQADIDALGSANPAPANNFSSQGCLWPDNPILSPPAGEQANLAAVPMDIFECDTTATDSPLHTVEVNQEDGWAVLDFVNSGGLWQLQVSVDEHPLWIITVDGDYVNVTEPVDSFLLVSGMRIQAALKLDGEPGSSYTIRAAALVVPQLISGYAVLQYKPCNDKASAKLVSPARGFPALPASTPYIGYNGLPLTVADGLQRNATIFEQAGPLAAPFIPTPPPSNDEVAQTFIYTMSRPNATQWAMNGTGLNRMYYEDNNPLIWKSVYQPFVDGTAGNTSMANSHSIEVIDNLNSVVDLIITVPNQDSPEHPIHKHLNKFWVIGEGAGLWTWPTVAEAAKDIPEAFNFVNPPLRDGYNTPAGAVATNGSWLALRYVADTAGPQTVHCHLSQHMGGGMVAVILQDMAKLQLPAEFDETSSQ
ncbi:multicopper oxidase [Cylindrobasidium torrendii FP15055 ss-10]|uniref:Multicopper oxidase n=1 Tax=Cylindrobasidium torrendii FP15055 ss-10 TaxID=1314674 RepID=A0A0D7BM04_9AGAR|nr:multicopper oxidase [Cylindrobasidium torrendii FP15055 ss-10]